MTSRKAAQGQVASQTTSPIGIIYALGITVARLRLDVHPQLPSTRLLRPEDSDSRENKQKTKTKTKNTVSANAKGNLFHSTFGKKKCNTR